MRVAVRNTKMALPYSELFDQNSFYKAFEKDLARANQELVIESPFITVRRLTHLLPIIKKLKKRGVRITVNTKDPFEYDTVRWQGEATKAVRLLQCAGVKVLYTVGHHRKLAIIDRAILWEGSLNILSQSDSCEIMRRTQSPEAAEQMLRFTITVTFVS